MTASPDVRNRVLVFVPTYDERDNAPELIRQLLAVDAPLDLLFVDDASPDGTGEILDRIAETEPRLKVIHRTGKLGIGSAHLAGISWAYDHGYRRLVTMDCDFTHSPADIPKFLAAAEGHDVVVGSRYLASGSLPGWNLLRRTITHTGHFLTRRLLKMPQDATGAFRLYDLDRVPRHVFGSVGSQGYSFFFESLFLLAQNGMRIGEVPITLPARTYGHSKMSLWEAWHSLCHVVRLSVIKLASPNRFRVPPPFEGVDPALVDDQHWDDYWRTKDRTTGMLYEVAATLYRNLFIKSYLERTIRREFRPGSRLLHAGCGSGDVDRRLQDEMRIDAVDISVAALRLYRRNNPRAVDVRHATIFRLPYEDGTFDGAYNLGVVEHFEEPDIRLILRELARVVRPDGRVVLFWPHRRATTAFVLDGMHWFLNRVLKRNVQLHPPEVTRFRSRKQVEPWFRDAGLEIESCRFGPRDGFVQVSVVARRTGPPDVPEKSDARTVSLAGGS
jgi:dolichol-phosphate mannosyltransferase